MELGKLCGECEHWKVDPAFPEGIVGRCRHSNNERRKDTFYATENCRIPAWTKRKVNA